MRIVLHYDSASLFFNKSLFKICKKCESSIMNQTMTGVYCYTLNTVCRQVNKSVVKVSDFYSQLPGGQAGPVG